MEKKEKELEDINEDDQEDEGTEKKNENFDLLNLGVNKDDKNDSINKKKEETDDVNFL